MRYRVGEFARLTGVTVRALQHYDRLGLLKPSRTESGHRIYLEADRQRVRHILALRAVGMSLQQIAALLKAPVSRLPAAFRDQRARLEQTQAGIHEAIEILARLDASDSGEGLLDRLASGVEMQDALESMRGYFSDDAWVNWGQQYFHDWLHDWPPAAWRALFRDIEASLGEAAGSERAQELLTRATTLWDASIGSDQELSRAVRDGYGRAWRSRDRWPRELQRRFAEFRVEEIAKFLGAAQMASWRQRGLIQTYTARRA